MVRFVQTVGDTPKNQKEKSVGTDWNWGQGGRAVALTETDARSLVTEVVRQVAEAVVASAKDGALDQYRQMARLETELTRAREDLSRANAENATLNGYIAQLNNLIVTLAPRNQVFPSAPTHVLPPQMPPIYIPAQNGLPTSTFTSGSGSE